MPTRPILQGFLRAHPVVTVRVPFHAIQRLSGLFRNDPVDTFTGFHQFARVDLYVRSVPTETASRLVDQKPGVRQRVAVLSLRRQVDVRGNAANPARADRPHHGFDVADHVEDGVTGLDVSARRTDEQGDRIIAFERHGEKPFRGALSAVLVDLAKDRQGAMLKERVLKE